LYLPLAGGRTNKNICGIPGDIQPYGFGSLDSEGAIYVVMNPAQGVEEIQMHAFREQRDESRPGADLSATLDSAVLSRDKIRLGPGQMAVVGFGEICNPKYDLGCRRMSRSTLHCSYRIGFFTPRKKSYRAEVIARREGRFADHDAQRREGREHRTELEGWTAEGHEYGKVFVLDGIAGRKASTGRVNYDKVIWSGLSGRGKDCTRTKARDSSVDECSSIEEGPGATAAGNGTRSGILRQAEPGFPAPW